MPHTITSLWLHPTTVDDLEAVDAAISEGVELVHVGPLPDFDGRYLIVAAPDLTAATDAVRRLLDRIDSTIYEARDEARDAERQPCAGGCGELVHPDDGETCGRRDCDERAAIDPDTGYPY